MLWNVSHNLSYYFGLPGGTWVVLCSLGTPWGANAKAKGLKLRAATGMEGCECQIGVFPSLPHHFAVFWGVLRGLCICGVYVPTSR